MSADNRSPRERKHLEVLGYYNPLPGQDGGKRMGLKYERVKYWLSVGGTAFRSGPTHSFQSWIISPTSYDGNGTQERTT
ncbi:hypothetical protein like AT5G56940 [Hibiscus trionum]|uniref:30S ribosomal protein S16 n=1 Tax=Hibiscus trionum TaxID=183268 RepID=A0A9W7IQ80_HIBTR|nr:hypothetical protein like AT5G56940 [Hibiscus trionum]GMI99371.1 hypothetical protein like AT5G56940 [Hibiscus trionum]